MKILGISAFYHDSAAAIVVDGNVEAAAQEERFTRKKQDASFPIKAIKYCLEFVGCTIEELDAIVFYDKPLLKFERLLETYYGFAPQGLKSFITAMPIWLREKLFLKQLIRKELVQLSAVEKPKINLLFTEHHQSHAASAFFVSPFDEATIVTVDGVGEWATASIGRGQGNDFTILKELHFPHSLGLLYSSFTQWLGFKVNGGEYKLMGLAPYGNPNSEAVKKYIQSIKSELIDINDDGSIWLNQDYFDYATGLSMVQKKKWKDLFGFEIRSSDDPIQPHHCDLAFAIQQITEEVMLKIVTHAKEITGAKNLCLAGGVALNCVANGKILKASIFDQIFIQPAAGDAGGALGAALAAYYQHFKKDRIINLEQSDGMSNAYLGPEYSELDMLKTIRKYKHEFEHIEKLEDLSIEVAKLIADGNVIGWFQGRMEYGPRALGNRSILGDPSNPEMQRIINLKIKYRESFRPFAPSVLEEDVSQYFNMSSPSPYMLLVTDVNEGKLNSIPDDYYELSMQDRLAYIKSELTSITHVDHTARVQTVAKESNYKYWSLLQAMKQQTGKGILLNTSFNVKDEPIVCSPEDAYQCFMNTEMDYLVLGTYILKKSKNQ